MNEQKYWEQVAFLEENNPSEILLNRLKSAFSQANAIIHLPFALKRIPEKIEEEEIVLRKYTITETEKNELNRQYGIAYGKTCKLSNKLHEYKQGNVPSELIDEILAGQHEMDCIADKLNGTYQEKSVAEPKNYEGVDKFKKINSLRSSICRLKKDLDQLIGSDDKVKITKKENQLQNQQIELSKLENKDIHE